MFVQCFALLFALLLSLLYRDSYDCNHCFKFFYVLGIPWASTCRILCQDLCCALCCARRHRVQHKSTHLSTPVFPMQNPCQLAHWHTCCTPCKTRANFGRSSCWHECCTPCKTHANSGHGTNVAHKQNTCQLWTCKSRATSYPQVIHRLPHARLVPTLRPSKTRANFRHAKVVPMLGRGRGLTCVDNCSSHSGTKKVKTRKKEP